jgi:hypothetical protein
MEYQGPAQLGDEQHATEVIVRIADVEDPNWTGVVLDRGDAEIPHVEAPIRLLGGLYEDWSATTILTRGPGSAQTLEACTPLTPPVGG